MWPGSRGRMFGHPIRRDSFLRNIKEQKIVGKRDLARLKALNKDGWWLLHPQEPISYIRR